MSEDYTDADLDGRDFVSEPARDVSDPPRDKEGLFIQPRDFSAKREVIEQKNRMRAAGHANFADPLVGLTNTFDPAGDYNCGRCNQVRGVKCLLVIIPRIDLEAGSCEDWEIQCAGDPEMLLHRKPKALANYGVAKNGKGFGCHRCPFAQKAYRRDSRGRGMYCRYFDFRTYWNACCTLNGAATVGG